MKSTRRCYPGYCQYLMPRAKAYVDSKSIEEYYVKRDLMVLPWWSKKLDPIAFMHRCPNLCESIVLNGPEPTMTIMMLVSGIASAIWSASMDEYATLVGFASMVASMVSMACICMAMYISCLDARHAINDAKLLKSMSHHVGKHGILCGV